MGFSHGRATAGRGGEDGHLRQEGGIFDSAGMSSSGRPHRHHYHHHHHHHFPQRDLGEPLAPDDDAPLTNSGISRDGETIREEEQRRQQQWHLGHGIGGAYWPHEAPTEHQPRQTAPSPQAAVGPDLLPFDGWFEGGVGASSDLGDVDNDEDDVGDGEEEDARPRDAAGIGTGARGGGRGNHLQLYGMP